MVHNRGPAIAPPRDEPTKGADERRANERTVSQSKSAVEAIISNALAVNRVGDTLEQFSVPLRRPLKFWGALRRLFSLFENFCEQNRCPSLPGL